jgi:dolichol-phosphate mannosyltransferase
MRAAEPFTAPKVMIPELDIVIPVYNEGRNIVAVLAGLSRAVATPARVLICYDQEEDDTLPAIRAAPQAYAGLPVELVRNRARGAHAAVMTGCPWLKALLVRSANFTLRHLARLPTTDASNGFRLFSRRAIERIPIESREGFCYSIELLVKAHRLRWNIAEVPVTWIERADGRTRFQVLRWLPAYLRWYGYAFATTFLRRPPRSVALKETGG